MAYLTEGQLRRVAQQQKSYKSLKLERSQAEAEIGVFLSHSHKDKELVLGLIALLARYKVDLYVDWQDDSMPRVTGKETAELVKQRIDELDLFMVLATANAMASRWVPWELGIADTRKKNNCIVLIPVADPSGRFEGNEYLQLYQHIAAISDGNRLGVFPPYGTSGTHLKNWFWQRLLEKSRRALDALSVD